MLRLGFGAFIAVINSLIAFYLKIWRVDDARKLFAELIDRDVVSWNSMICVYVANGLSEKGVELFKEMLYFGVEMDLVTQWPVFFELVLTVVMFHWVVMSGFLKNIKTSK